MNKFLLWLLIPVFFIGCKNTETRVYELVSDYNQAKGAISHPSLKHTKAYSLNKRTVSLDFIFETKEDTLSQGHTGQLSSILKQVGQKYPDAKKLMKDGMNFKLRAYNAFGVQIAEFPLEVDDAGVLKAGT